MNTPELPTPEHRTALLVPDLRDRAGHPLHLTPTLHHYSHTEQHDFDGGRKHADSPEAVHDFGFRHIFECSVTGATRVYGCEGPSSPGIADDSEED